jgi:trk system potassium uptake protein TrkH
MINLRVIARVFSQILIVEGIFMLISGAVSWVYKEHAAYSFLYSALITLITGILVYTPLRNTEKLYGTREGYIINICIWLLFSTFGSLPFLFTSSTHNLTDAFFESISGFTTTGATIFTDVESLSHGVLFWRSLTQWLGGITIITLASYILPVDKSLNIQLATNEFSGQMTDKIHPKVIETAKRLISIYTVLTILEALLLVLGKMPFFDAVCHSLSTLSTGGFSTHNNGLAAFSSPYVKAIITIFMFFAGTNPALFYFGLKGNYKKISGNNELVFYGKLVLGFSLIVSFLLFIVKGTSVPAALSDGFFHTISIITTTGFYTSNFTQWGNLLILIIFILMFTGGMAGSASGGIKAIRLLIITRISKTEVRKLIHPNAYLPVRIDQKKVPSNIVYNLLIFIVLYFISVCVGALVISFLDYDIITAFSVSASMIGNIGPGLGTFGPFTSYADLAPAGKWILSALMLLGRLELLTLLVLFSRSFYKK